MSDLTVESMFAERSYTARAVLRDSGMTVSDRRRMIGHTVAAVTQKILAAPNVNPVGLAVTVTETTGSEVVEIVATCPQYELSELFLDS